MIAAEKIAPRRLACLPIPSLLGAPISELEDLRAGDVAMVGLFLDHGDGSRFGKRFAARQLRYASSQASMRPPDGPYGRWLDLGDLNVFPLEPERQVEALCRQLRAIAATGATPLVVGGRDLPVPLSRCLAPGAARDARLPGGTFPGGPGRLALVLDLASLLGGFAEPRAASRMRAEALALPRERIAAVHLTGFAPDPDVGGRHEASLAVRTLACVAAHLTGADTCL